MANKRRFPSKSARLAHFSCFSAYTAIGYRNIPNTYTAPAHGDEKIHVNTPRRPRRRWPGSTFAKAMDKPRARPSRQTVHRPSTHRSQRRDRTAGKLTGKLWRIVHGSSTVHLSPSRHVDANRRSPVEDGRAARRIPKQEPRCLGECTLLRHARSSHDDAHHGCSPYGDAHNSARWRGGGSTISDNRAWREGRCGLDRSSRGREQRQECRERELKLQAEASVSRL